MSIFGMGPLEIIVILLLAFIFLGPSKMIDAAHVLGKASREFRRMASELSSAQLLAEKELSVRDRLDTDNSASDSSSSRESKLDEDPIAFQTPSPQKDDSEQPKG